MKSIDPAMASKFIEKFSDVFENNINIMDNKGIIIGSKDPSRLGSFHEVAYSLLSDKSKTGDVNESDLYLGTKKGVNYRINYKNRAVGVVGVSGKVEEVRAIGLIIKTAIESMLEYEVQMETERVQHTKIEQFLYAIIYDDEFNSAAVNAIASTLNYKNHCIRVPIIMNTHNQMEPKQLTQLINNLEEHSYQDIITVLKNNNVIVFKYLEDKNSNAIADYKDEIDFFLAAVLGKLSPKADVSQISFCVGTLQNSFKNYKEAYNHVSWLNMFIKNTSGTYFFYDYVSDFFKGLATLKVYDEIFNTFDTILTDEKRQMLVEVFQVLIENNYNVVNSAKELYIHRNTLLFRINKINQLLNIDPISNYADRELMSHLVYYYKNK